MRVDVVRAVLRVVLEHEDQRVVRVAAVRDLLDEQADRVVVVRLLRLGRVHAVDRRVEAAHVVVREAAPSRASAALPLGDVAVELALPLLEAPEVGQVGVEAAEVGIGERQQLGLDAVDDTARPSVNGSRSTGMPPQRAGALYSVRSTKKP